MRFGEGTFLRVELCQQSSYSLVVGLFNIPLEAFDVTDTGYLPENSALVAEHTDGFVGASFVDLLLDNSC